MTRPRPAFIAAALLLVAAALFLWKGPSSRDPSAGSAASPVHVLYIGNSLTFVNDLPSLVRSLGEADGQDLAYTRHALPSATLEQHEENADVADLLAKHWSFVVLQEQSHLPSLDATSRAESQSALTKLVDKARAQKSEPILFATWAYRNGDRAFVPNDTYEAMQDRLDAGFASLAKATNVRIVPVSTAWREAHRTHAEWNLWLADGIHPALAGSYLAACVFYDAMTKRSPRGNGFNPGIPADEARVLQEIAERAVPQ